MASGSIGNTGLLTGAKSSAAGTSAFVSGALSDPFLSLNGVNSVVGRSIVVSNSNGFALGTCVIGRGYETTAVGANVHDQLPSDGATCVLKSTGLDAPPLGVASMGNYPGR